MGGSFLAATHALWVQQRHPPGNARLNAADSERAATSRSSAASGGEAAGGGIGHRRHRYCRLRVGTGSPIKWRWSGCKLQRSADRLLVGTACDFAPNAELAARERLLVTGEAVKVQRSVRVAMLARRTEGLSHGGPLQPLRSTVELVDSA